MNIVNWIKDLWNAPEYFSLDATKEYTPSELIEILKHEYLRVGTGNAIILKILDELVKKHEK